MRKGMTAVRGRAARPPQRRKGIGQGLHLMIWVAVFSAFYLLRDVAGLGVPEIVFTGICGMAFLFLDPGASLGMYIFTTALTVPHNEIRIVYMALICLKLFRVGRLRLRAGMLMLMLGCMLLQLVNSCLFSDLGVSELAYDYVTRMLIFLLPLVWYSVNASPGQYRRAVLCYLWGVMLGGTVALILTSRTEGFIKLLTGSRFARLGHVSDAVATGMRTAYNANQLGSMLAIAIAILLAYMDRGYLPRMLSFAAIGYALILLMMTKSRTGLLTAIGVFVMYYWVAVIRKGRIRQGLLIFAAMVLTVLLVVTLIPEVVTAVTNRFINQTDITNGRTDLMVMYLREWVGNAWSFLFGYGIGSYQGVVNFGAGLVPHNIITDTLICWGLVGLVLVGWILWMMYRRNRPGVRRADVVLAYLPAIAALVVTMAGQYLTTGYPHMRLCFLLLAARGFAGAAPVQASRAPEVA